MEHRRRFGFTSALGTALTLALALALAAPAAAQQLVQRASQAGNIGSSTLWIASLGDSFSSGEGNPHNAAGISAPINSMKWLDDERCHRSKHAWPYLVVGRLEGSVSLPVRFTFLACSGAELQDGLLESYTTNRPGERHTVRGPQLERLARMIEAAGRTPDIVLLSGGGNDIGFGDIVYECLTPWDSGALPGKCPGKRLKQEVHARLGTLAGPGGSGGRYARVAEALGRMGIESDRVFMLIYPNPLKGKKRKLGGGWTRYKPLAACYLALPFGKGRKAWGWASAQIVEPLQGLGRAVADRHGWHRIESHLTPYKRHSYCPRKSGLHGPGSWWVGMLHQSSLLRQWGFYGVFHPNEAGHRAMANAAMELVRPVALRIAQERQVAHGGGGPTGRDMGSRRLPVTADGDRARGGVDGTRPRDGTGGRTDPCCRIVSVDLRSGLATARPSSGEETFRFRVNDPALLRSLRRGVSFGIAPPLDQLEEGATFSLVHVVQTPKGRVSAPRIPARDRRALRDCCEFRGSQPATEVRRRPSDLRPPRPPR